MGKKVIVVAGTSSGVGKTSMTVGILRALRNRGLAVQAFKVGPDFLDPMHHEEATGRPSVNLDGWMLEKEQNLRSFHRAMVGADIAVVEGVMGLFDGHNGRSEVGSTAQMAKWLGAPVVLVLDCWALSRSAAAMIKGYKVFDEELVLGGVLLNRIGGDSHKHWLQEAVESSGLSVEVLGGIPKDDSVAVKERHLGLHRPADLDVPGDNAQRLGRLIEKHVDLDKLLEVAGRAEVPHLEWEIPEPPPGPKVRIAVARDGAFCFYYTENLQLLRESGAEIVFFSPLHDKFPEDVAGIYLGGGYPELYAAELSARRDMRAAVKAFAEAGGVVYAECGGLLYLSQSIQPLDKMPASMVGIFPFRTHMTEKSMKMGYVEVETKSLCALFPWDQKVRGHVYHFSEILQERVVGGFANGHALTPGGGGEGWEAGYAATLQLPGATPVEEGFTWRNVLASYVHLHFGSNPSLAAALVDRCRQVDVAAVSSAVSSAPTRNSYDTVPPLPPISRMKAAQSSPNLQGLARRKGNMHRAMSVDLGPNGQGCEGDTSPFNIEESFRRAEAARAMSMDVSHVPGVESWPVPHLLTGGTVESFTPSDPSPSSSPTRTSPNGSLESRSHLATSPSIADQMNDGDLRQDGGYHASTSGREDLPPPLPRIGSSRMHLCELLSARSGVEYQRSDAIVSLLPSGTEILFALGLDRRVIGVTDLCSYPAAARERPQVSHSTIDTSTMSMEEVEVQMQRCKAEGRSPFVVDGEFLARHQPGLVLTQDTCQSCDPSTAQVLQAFNQAGLGNDNCQTQLVQLNPRTVSDIFDSIFQVALAAGVYGEALRLVDRLRARLRVVAAMVAKDSHRPRVLSLEGLVPLCLGGLWLPEMKELAGGECELQQGGDPPLRITWDQVREFEPEVLILSPCSCNPSRSLSEVAPLAGLPGWWSLPAVKTGQVYIIDHNYFSRPGPRIVEGVEILARILHPEVVHQRAPENSVLKLSLKGGQRCRQRLIQNYFLPFQ